MKSESKVSYVEDLRRILVIEGSSEDEERQGQDQRKGEAKGKVAGKGPSQRLNLGKQRLPFFRHV